jgi:hypothetical protein
MTIAYAGAGIAALLVAKINHPLLGDKFGEETASGDPESSSWRM